jgi:TRAP-type C4-dicarboxylate transport system substrate-binding protein
MKNKHWFSIFVAIAISLLFVQFSFAQTLRFNYSIPKGKSVSSSWEWFGQELEKKTEGKVKVAFFPHGALFKIKASRDNILAGTADICNLSLVAEATRMPLSSIVMLVSVSWPYTTDGMIDAGNAMHTLMKEFPEVAAEYKDFKVLAFPMLNRYHIIAKKPILLPEDIKGLKFKSGGAQGTFIKSLGGAQVALSPPKSYMALKTGVIDGGVVSYSQMNIYKLWEVAKHVTDVDMGRVLLPVVMNKATWESLPADVQKTIDSLTPEMVKQGAEKLTKIQVKGAKAMAENGEVHNLTPDQKKAWQDAKGNSEKEWLENCHKKGLGDVGEKVLKRYKELAAESTNRSAAGK